MIDYEAAKAEAAAAFEVAITTGRLSEQCGDANWAGHYMYMGTHDRTGRAAFKHRNTREYIK
jgi:hypothetical protein